MTTTNTNTPGQPLNVGGEGNAQVPPPAFQPGSIDPENKRFTSSEVWWWDNGIWGSAGYAIPNDGGKPRTGNERMRDLHAFIGKEMFVLMHKPDVKFSRPFNAEWLFDLLKMLNLGIKRLNDIAVGFGDKRQGDAEHALNTPEAFNVYPVPYFGGRIRQRDARRWCGIILILLSEIMQHSDNDFDDDVTDFSASMAQRHLERIRRDMAMKYLGYSREETEAAGFTVDPARLGKGVYDPSQLFTSHEMVEERMPEQWWPQANDLSSIMAGIPAPVARQWARRWPEAGDLGDGGAHEQAFPGGGTGSGVIPEPGRPSL